MVNWKFESVSIAVKGVASIAIRLNERPWISKFEIGGGNKITYLIFI